MDRRRWLLLTSTAGAGTACAVAVVSPGAGLVADAAVALAGLATAILLWTVGAGAERGPRGWRLLALAPLFPAIGMLLCLLLPPVDPLELVVLRWLPALPGYLLGLAGILTLADRVRLRTGAAAATEMALFGSACVVLTQLLFFGPGGGWEALGTLGRGAVIGGVVVTSATIAAALILLGAVDSRRQPMAWALLGSAVLLTAGRGLGTSAVFSSATVTSGLGRFLVLGGLALLGLAVLLDPRSGSATDASAPSAPGRYTELGNLLPHAAMALAVVVVGGVTLLGYHPSPVTVIGTVTCVGLAPVHRWLTAREERRMGARLQRSEAYFRSLVRASGDAVLILDDDLRITWASPALDAVLGRETGALRGRDLLELAHAGDALPLARTLRGEPGAAPAPDLLTIRMPHADGSWRHLEASVSDLRSDADVGAVVLHCRDMTERYARERALEEVAFTDPLTGLANRAGCMRVLGETLAAASAGGPRATFLLIELDGLDAVREDAGRDLVTTVLAELGRRLRGTVRGDELVARLGSGAFAILAAGSGHTADLLADRCLSVVEQPIATPDGIYDLAGNVGVVDLAPGESVADLMARAELAVRAASRAGHGIAMRYDAALGNAAARRARLREDLPGASARGEMSVLFQPVVSLQEQRITGVEALLRWRHPELGDVPPEEFVPIAERAGVIGELQRWALDRAATAAMSLPEGDVPLRLGVNISASHVAARTLVGDVAAVLRTTGLPPERLALEITEATVLAGGDYVAVDIEALRLMGVHVALDDFGTGQSSLAHLTRLPIDVLKLDQSFVSRVDRDRQSRALCESVVGIGRSLGLEVVAEGVETPAQLAVLMGLGCGFAQGFLLARPMRLGELVELLESGAGVLWPGLVGSR